MLHIFYGHVNITLQSLMWDLSGQVVWTYPRCYQLNIWAALCLRNVGMEGMSPGKQKFSVVSCAINVFIFLPSDLTFSIMIKERFLSFPCCLPDCCPFLVALFSLPFVLSGFLFCLFTQYLRENVWDDLSVVCCVLPQQDQLVTCVLTLAVWKEPK